MARRDPPDVEADMTLDAEKADDSRVVQRPDGYHWLSPDGNREVGPFASYEAAEFDLRADQHSDIEPDETLTEAESEIGIADWIDPETGEPAEEQRPRLEDH